jgi:hypothetical protein
MKKIIYYCDRCGKQMEGRTKVILRQAYEFVAVEGNKRYCDVLMLKQGRLLLKQYGEVSLTNTS